MSLGEVLFAVPLDGYLGVKLLILKVCTYSEWIDIAREFSEVLTPISFPSAKYGSISCFVPRRIEKFAVGLRAEGEPAIKSRRRPLRLSGGVDRG